MYQNFEQTVEKNETVNGVNELKTHQGYSAYILKSQTRNVLSRELEMRIWSSGAASCRFIIQSIKLCTE